MNARSNMTPLAMIVLAAMSGSPGLALEESPVTAKEENKLLASETLAGLKFRSIGPALMSGRIGDFAVDPHNRVHYYVAVASGGVWKTENAGTTFTPVFDGEGSYSIGCITMDPSNPSIVWVGTGENNSQRSVSFGDGVYKTVNGGKSWTNLGLKGSEHVGMITIDPRNSDVVYVAAQGPLWRAGGDRGLYKTTNGGKSWERVLHISDDTGINEVHLDPRNPDVLYASAYQRRRHVWTLVNGGPESAVYKSTDAGGSWRKVSQGLPAVDLGRIGMCVSPANPDIVYAIVEAADENSGFFRSTDRGETWEKRNKITTTSPQYYNEIVCDPLVEDRVYLLDTFMHVTQDGGKTFQRVPRRFRHVDDHALWIDPGNNDYLLVGCDGGVYESFDRAQNWHYKTNLPVTQFYRVAVDNAEPFYNIYGGTQDNNTLGGPSRTTDRVGIANEHWFVTVGGDGFETQVDPEDPNIVYSQWQYGNLVRHDRRSGEIVDIKPVEAPGEEPYKWNWNSPLLISPHDHKRLYFAGNRLFRSDDRGDSWRAVSGDLTRGIDRNQLKVMGRIQSIDAVDHHQHTSIFGNSVALSESPLQEGLIYVGTDDGLVHVTSDGGQTWRKIEVFPFVPDMTYVSFLFASKHEADTVFASFDNHKNGDFKPYLLKSTDRGQTWRSITGDLPDREIIYTIGQDHVVPNLLFVGTEFGVYVSPDGGEHWIRLKGGIPTIAVRDLVIQERENDLVLGTFGRGFYVLDDYTPLRLISDDLLQKDAVLFPVKNAWRYLERSRLGGRTGRGSQGASFYAAPNPHFGAVFTYYLKEKLTSRKEQRQEAEKKAIKAGKPIRIPTIEELRAEDEEKPPTIYLVVEDETGAVVRRVEGSREKGIHRAAWDLRVPSVLPIELRMEEDLPPWVMSPTGHLAWPGTYRVTLVKEVDGEMMPVSETQPFEVMPLELATFAAKDRSELYDFQKKLARLRRAVRGALKASQETQSRLNHLEKAVLEAPAADHAWLAEVRKLRDRLNGMLTQLRGDQTRSRRMEPAMPSIVARVEDVANSLWYATSPPTQTQRDNYRYAGEAFAATLADLRSLITKDLAELEAKLERAGAPWTPGRLPTWEME